MKRFKQALELENKTRENRFQNKRESFLKVTKIV